MKCPVCNDKKSVAVIKNNHKFSNGTVYDICRCRSCYSRFIMPFSVDLSVYETLHSKKNSTYDTMYQKKLSVYKKFFDKNNVPKYRQLLFDAASKYEFIITQIENISGAKNKKILEVGCATGILAGYFILNGYDITAIDISKTAVETASSVYGNYFFAKGVDEIKDQSFDIIYFVGFIGVLDNPSAFLDTVSSMLNPGGIILFNSPNGKALGRERLWVNTDPPDVRGVYKKETFTKLFNKKGFTLECFYGFFNWQYSKTLPLDKIYGRLKSKLLQDKEYELFVIIKNVKGGKKKMKQSVKLSLGLGALGGIGCLGILLKNKFKKTDTKEPPAKDRLRYNYKICNQWLANKNAGVSLADELLGRGYKNIAVYGCGELGARLAEELRGSAVIIDYFIDKSDTAVYGEYDVVSIEELSDVKSVDAIIITPYCFEEIEETLSEIVDTEICCLESLIFS